MPTRPHPQFINPVLHFGFENALQKTAEVNSRDKFQLVFRQVLESGFIERMELNEELFTDYMGKPEMQELVSRWLGS